MEFWDFGGGRVGWMYGIPLNLGFLEFATTLRSYSKEGCHLKRVCKGTFIASTTMGP